jgi:hypothetical protein
MTYILKNNNFKKYILINTFNLEFILRKKEELKFFCNTGLRDRTFLYLAVMDIKDYAYLESV